MNRAYSVSQLYDETGSAQARHYKALQAAQARQLADLVKGHDSRLISRVLACLRAGLVAVGGNLGSRRGENVQFARL